MKFDLYRLRMVQIEGDNIFAHDRNIDQILSDCLESALKYSNDKAVKWKVGDLEKIDDTGYYLRIGKLTNLVINNYQNSSFTEKQQISSPYTDIYIDVKTEVVAIAKNLKLSSKTSTVANRFKDLLAKNDVIEAKGISFQIDPIRETNAFIEFLNSSDSILKFTFDVSRPNHFDAETNLIKPVEEAVQDMSADKAKISISGSDLDQKLLTEMTKKVAASGNSVSARAKKYKESKPETRRLADDNVEIEFNDHSSLKDDKKILLDIMRNKYDELSS